jgi:hypothetical protein
MNSAQLCDEFSPLFEEVSMAGSACSEIVFVATSVLLAVTAGAQIPVQHPVLGAGWGVDHIGIGVRDIIQARHDYEQLGFKVSVGGHFPGGLSNCAVSLPKSGYLELLSVTGTPVARSDAVCWLFGTYGSVPRSRLPGTNSPYCWK